MFLVAGLGNPGEEYALSPHNLGFLTIDRLAERHGIRVNRRDSKALTGVGAAIAPSSLTDATESALLIKHFSSITAENVMKPDTIWPSVPTDIRSPIPRPRNASGRIRWMIVVTATSTM